MISSSTFSGQQTWQINSQTGGELTENSGPSESAIIGNLSDGKWHTILLIHEANSDVVMAYFDRKPAAGDWPVGRVDLNDFGIGVNRAGNQNASVDLDNIKIWNKALVAP